MSADGHRTVAERVAEVADLLERAWPHWSGSAWAVRTRWPTGRVATGPTAGGADGATRSTGGRPVLSDVLALGTGRVSRLVDALPRSEREADDPTAATVPRDRALLAAGHLAADLPG